MDIFEHNRLAWNRCVRDGNQWTVPVSGEEIEAAARGDFRIVLTPKKPVPADWLRDLAGARVLCLASGGGQQGPLLAAAGAKVTVYDNSDDQLRRDAELSERHDLGIVTIRGNMQNLRELENRAFDLIVHPVSNCFIDDVRPVWRECRRVLAEGGRLLAGFCNSVSFAIDWNEADATGRCVVKHPIPYSDLEALSEDEKERYRRERIPFEFGHSLSDLIQGQIEAGFVITGFYEDRGDEALDKYVDRFIATRAVAIPPETPRDSGRA